MESTDTLSADHLPLDIGGRQQQFSERRKRFQAIIPEEGISLETVEKEYIRLAPGADQQQHDQSGEAAAGQLRYAALSGEEV